MSRIKSQFAKLKAQDRKALVTFITAGDPSIAMTPGYMHALVKGGADIIELGVPFSDPMADGPTIQKASERALLEGTSIDDVLSCVRVFREQDKDTPVVLMGYLNPFERSGYKEFADAASGAGVDGVLVVDLPPGSSPEFELALKSADLDQILLIAPNSSTERMQAICEAASGFVYFVSVKGVTGNKSAEVDHVSNQVNAARSMTELPLGIGFGIRTPEAAQQAARHADAVIVGSALVDIVAEGGSESEKVSRGLTGLCAQLRAALDAVADAA